MSSNYGYHLIPIVYGNHDNGVMYPRNQWCGTREEKYRNAFLGLGITEVIFGILSCILCIVTLVICTVMPHVYYIEVKWTYVAPGLWCSPFIIASGIIGILTKKRLSTNMLNFNMAFSIIAAVFMAILALLSIAACEYGGRSSVITIHVFLVCFGFLGIVLCAMHSALCCAGLCCFPHLNQSIRNAGFQQFSSLSSFHNGNVRTPLQTVGAQGDILLLKP